MVVSVDLTVELANQVSNLKSEKMHGWVTTSAGLAAGLHGWLTDDRSYSVRVQPVVQLGEYAYSCTRNSVLLFSMLSNVWSD